MYLSEQEIIRRKKLKKISELGIENYPAATYNTSASIKELIEKYEKNKNASVAGRIMRMRIMGKSSFVELKDYSGIIQLYVKRDDISENKEKTFYNIFFKKLLDVGDIIGVKGFMFKTRTGEITLHVKELVLLCKSLRPLPHVKTDNNGNIYDAFSTQEQRYRMRYIDLIVNDKIKQIFLQRTRIIQYIRNFLNEYGYLEVETPILQSVAGGAHALPFVTYHNTLNIPLYLRISNELYLKRLIVGGFNGVYEFSRDFRNEGMDRTHNPEFVILELYVAYKDYYWMMNFTEILLEKLCFNIHGSTEINIEGQTISFKKSFPRIPIYEAIQIHTGFDISKMNEKELQMVCKKLEIEVDKTMGKGKLIDEIFSKKCEKHYIQPTFIIDYPVEMSPLTKKHREKKGLTERFELFINKKEIANAYSELNDPIDQLERFKEQIYEKGNDESMRIDYDFIRSLEFGMPPTSGIGIGIDRLVMLLTKQNSIQEVLLFPQMRPDKNNL
ncbi:lysine--tRNA ligase [Candidatus Walczuchella monophlebidarum]|uniref:Lysine--tRNA ligase n=1 Tax=Candidatus Walczuchella monophlebidarum TaxID=1415657 RepID=A0A068DS26_9FLAO|nr:lysine--tRNA ligase [Candidatus Walczuchella monophlebidarum]AID37431.1 lysyl-tRNA synthetase [Candidatus Walczuchella monophlebidarum]